jgi:anaerobic magnesium-protoporphyrin IX monomethyl ester cyclase
MAGLDALFVNVGGTRKKIYQGLSKDFAGIELPSWVALTAGFIRKRGYEVDILDANILGLDAKETAEAIIKREPGLTGIVVYGQQANTSTPTMVGVRELCKEIKRQDPNRKIVLTGWHPSALPERTLLEERCDFVGQGEGFYVYLGLLEGKKFSEIPGLWWRESGSIRHNPPQKNIENLTDELSDIPWDLLPMGKYRAFNWHALSDLETRAQYASLYTSFGCSFNCNFCSIHANFGEKRIRSWEPEWVLKQIDHLVEKYSIKHLKINDEMFVFNPGHFMPIVEGLIEREYGLNIAAFARVDAVKEEHLEKLKKAGVNWLEFGIETGNDRIIKEIHKGKYTKKDITEIVKKIHGAGIELCANFMFGFPQDTYDTMQETLDLAFELEPAFPSFFCVIANPGSEMYNDVLKRGWKLPDTWDGYAQQGYGFLPIQTEHLSAEEVLKFRDYAFNSYFRNPKYQHMIERKFGKKAREHVAEMAKYDLKRKVLGD